MKYFIFLILLLEQSAHCSFRRLPHDPTPAEKKYVNSLRQTYDPFKDVRLNDKRPTSSLPLLTAKNLKEHRNALNSEEYKKQNPVPPIILEQLKQKAYRKWSQDPRYAPFIK